MRGNRNGESSNDSPEIPDRRGTSHIPNLSSGIRNMYLNWCSSTFTVPRVLCVYGVGWGGGGGECSVSKYSGMVQSVDTKYKESYCIFGTWQLLFIYLTVSPEASPDFPSPTISCRMLTITVWCNALGSAAESGSFSVSPHHAHQLLIINLCHTTFKNRPTVASKCCACVMKHFCPHASKIQDLFAGLL